MFTWDLWKQRLAGRPAGYRVMEGHPLLLLGSEVLSIHSLPWSSSAPQSTLESECAPPPPPKKGLFYTHGFPGAFSKGTKGAWGWGCLKVKVAADTVPLVNSIFILHPHQLRIYIWSGGGGGFRSSPGRVRVGEVCI